MFEWMIAVWLILAVVLFVPTFLDGEIVGKAKWDAGRVAGLIACFVWPAALLAFLGFRLNHSQNATRVARATAERKFLASLS